MSDRKYRQRGYQDDTPRREKAERPAAGRREAGPRGRGLGKPVGERSKCARCGARVTAAPAPGAVCGACGAHLHTCTNCRHFDPSARFECRLPVPERIAGKAADNECDRFEVKVVQEVGDSDRPEDARAAFDALFDL